MTKRRKIIVYIATSADGYIARRDGSVDWLDRQGTAGDYGMGAFFKTIDTILWGRKTYGVGLEMNEGGLGVYGSRIKNYIFSRRPPKTHAPDVEFVKESIGEFAKRLRASPGKDIWMMGGGGIIASFLDAGEIDEFVIHVIPTFIGEGIPLVAPKSRNVELKLLSVRDYPDGVVRLHYVVERTVEKPKGVAKKGGLKGRSR
jgi:dihydrofolate reductase